jgi:DNA polymerase III subunit beta
MSWEIDRKKLVGALKLASACVRLKRTETEKKTALPILNHVLLENCGEDIELCATDLDREIAIRLEANTDSCPAIAVDALLLSEIATNGSGAVVRLEPEEDGYVVVRCGRGKFTLPCLLAGEFPTLGRLGHDFPHSYQLEDGTLQTALREVAYAADLEALYFYYQGVNVHQADDKWCCVAANGHRFAKVELPGLGDLPTFILPLRSAAAVWKLFREKVNLRLSKHLACFTGSGIAFTTKLIDSTWPDYTKLIPERPQHVVEANREEFAATISRVVPFAENAGISCSVDAGKIVVSAQCKGKRGADELPCSGDLPYDFRVEPAYMLDALGKLQGETVRLEFTERGLAVVMRDGREGVLHLVMPRRF